MAEHFWSLCGETSASERQRHFSRKVSIFSAMHSSLSFGDSSYSIVVLSQELHKFQYMIFFSLLSSFSI